MGVNYLNGNSWSQITREERYFCAHLFFLIRNDLRKFLEWFKTNHYKEMNLDKQWEVGYEVCFYRDFLYSQGKSVKESKYPQKRTFDLTLLSDAELIIFEAKVYENFNTKQIEVFQKDNFLLKELIKIPVTIRFYALATGSYFENSRKYRTWDRSDTPVPDENKCFDGKISWKELADFYQDDVLYRADELRTEKNLYE